MQYGFVYANEISLTSLVTSVLTSQKRIFLCGLKSIRPFASDLKTPGDGLILADSENRSDGLMGLE